MSNFNEMSSGLGDGSGNSLILRHTVKLGLDKQHRDLGRMEASSLYKPNRIRRWKQIQSVAVEKKESSLKQLWI